MGLLGIITSPIISGIGAILGAGSQNTPAAQTPDAPKATSTDSMPAAAAPEAQPESTSQQGVIIETILQDALTAAEPVLPAPPEEAAAASAETVAAVETAPETLGDVIAERTATAAPPADVETSAGAGLGGAVAAPTTSDTVVSPAIDGATEEDAARAAAEAATLAAREAGVLERLRSNAPEPTAALRDASSSDAAAAQQAYGATSLTIISPVATTGPRALQAAL